MNIHTLVGKLRLTSHDVFLAFLESQAETRSLPFRAGLIDGDSGGLKLPGIVDADNRGVALTADHQEAVMYCKLVNESVDAEDGIVAFDSVHQSFATAA